MEQALAKVEESAISTFTPSASCGFYFDIHKFEHAQRVAKMFSQSTMVPEQFRNNIGNCLIALNLADRFRLDPFMVMQKMYIVHGKPGIEAQLAIALINASGKFTPLEFELTGEDDNRQCVACATKKADGRLLKGPVVSIKMAKDEGWMGKSGSKWRTMPDLMLTYRSATFFGRIYAPEALMGLSTDDEVVDISVKDITPKTANVIDIKALGATSDMSIYAPQPQPESEVIDIPAQPPQGPSEHDRAMIKIYELSNTNQRLVDKHLAGRNVDNLSFDELLGVIDGVEDEMR